VGDVAEATESSLDAARHLTDMDKGAVEALRALAVKIDEEAERWELAFTYASEHKLKPPAPDNVALPTYLRYCEALGLTPSGRVRLGPAKDGAGGKLAQLRSVAGTA